MTVLAENAALWLPTTERESHFTSPSRQELEEQWGSLHTAEIFLKLPEEIYGACRVPETSPAGYAVLDLCEVVRETGLGVLKLRGGTLDDMTYESSTNVPDYGAVLNGWGDPTDAQNQRSLHIQELMYHDLIPPVRMSEGISALIRDWRARGVYVVANTSTLAGCERSTVSFLAKHYIGCFDGILFPRNHDGLGPISKADAFIATQQAINRLHGDAQRPVVFIDDSAHHAVAFTDGVEDAKVIMPEYKWNQICDENTRIDRVSQTIGTIDAFIVADQYFSEKEV